MLESVVQDDQLRFQFLDGDFSGGHAVGILQVRHVGEFLLQFAGLVVPPAFLGPITAADNRHAHLMIAKPSGDPLDQRRFARPAQGDIAHAYHGHDRAMDRRLALIVAPISPRHGQRIRHFGQSQHPAQ